MNCLYKRKDEAAPTNSELSIFDHMRKQMRSLNSQNKPKSDKTYSCILSDLYNLCTDVKGEISEIIKPSSLQGSKKSIEPPPDNYKRKRKLKNNRVEREMNLSCCSNSYEGSKGSSGSRRKRHSSGDSSLFKLLDEKTRPSIALHSCPVCIPIEIVHIRQIGPHSILLQWKLTESEIHVCGYDIFVDEILNTRVFSGERKVAILDGLHLDANALMIAIHAVTANGRCQPAVAMF